MKKHFLFLLLPCCLLSACGETPDDTLKTQQTAAPEPEDENELVEGNAAAEPDLPLDLIQLPEGFSISLFAADVPGARSMRWSEDNVLYVGTRQKGSVYAIPDEDHDGQADEVLTVAEGLNSPNGIALRDGDLYVAEIGRILRFPNIGESYRRNPSFQVVTDEYPEDDHHGWKFIAFDPQEEWLYVPVGAPCNVCNPENPIYSTITRIRPDGSDLQVYAHGIRNSVGFDWHPQTGELWFTDNGRDWLGDNMPSDELNRAPRKGLHFGFPFCHAGDIPDPEFGLERDCEEFVPPAEKLGPHVAALGMRFYTGDMFPETYRNNIILAEHGSWNRTTPLGYRLVRAEVEDGEVTETAIFASGWLQNGEAWGRPVDVEVLPDGSLLVSDDKAGVIYRITYNGSK